MAPEHEPTSSHRPPWTELPGALQQRIIETLGASVASSRTCRGGFTSGVADVLTLQSGECVFLKALRLGDTQADSYRREALINEALPANLPKPDLRFYFESEGWIVLCFDGIDGRMPGGPWTRGDLELVASLLKEVSQTLTPNPYPAARRIEYAYADEFFVWQALAETGVAGARRIAQLGDLRRSVDRLAAVESHWQEATTGNTLAHLDVRSDNLIIDRQSRVWMLDWAHPVACAPWIDTVAFLCSVGGPPGTKEDLLSLAVPEKSQYREAIDTFLVAVAGMWVGRSAEPELPGRRLRTQQAESAMATIDWLRYRGMRIPQLTL